MSIKMMWGDQELEVKNLEYTIDNSTVGDVPEAIDLALLQQAEVTVTLRLEYYRVMLLANMLERHSPKKAQQLRRRFEYLNPLRLLGLI